MACESFLQALELCAATRRIGVEKVQELQKKLKDLRDLNRVTAAFEDPFALFVFFLVLRKHLKISGIKNWFHPDPQNPGAEGEFSRPPVLHLFVDWDGAGYQVEVMLMLQNFLEVKKAQHLVYEILRAPSVAEVLKPLRAHPGDELPEQVPDATAAPETATSVFSLALLELPLR